MSTKTILDLSHEDETVTLKKLSELVGFPSELIKEELLLNVQDEGSPIQLENLRLAMMNYVNQAMLEEDGAKDLELSGEEEE